MTEELKPCPCWQRDHNPCTCWQKNHRDGCPAQADKDTVTLKRSEVEDAIDILINAKSNSFNKNTCERISLAIEILETALKEGV